MNAINCVTQALELSPRPEISVLNHQGLRTYVVRDDLLPGGTKQRAAAPYIRDMMDLGFDHFVYASPFSGFAQVALSYVCQILEVRCTIICERDKRYEAPRLHPFSKLAEQFGAKVVLVDSLAEAEKLGETLPFYQSKTMKIPLGFDCQEFRDHLCKEIVTSWKYLEKKIGHVRTLWLPVGSGTLARTFLKALPEHTKIKCVNVRVLSSEDPRLKEVRGNDRVSFYEAPMAFHEEANEFPKIPSNAFYDAKLWEFITRVGGDNDVWWNVAR